MYDRIVIPVDGSENGESAIPHGVAIAQHFDSTIHVLSAVDLQAAGGVFNAGGLEKEFIERLEVRGHTAVHRVTDEIVDIASGVKVHTAVERTTSFEGAATGVRD